MTVLDALYLHLTVMGVLLAAVGLSLSRRGLFHWLSAGFWAWASMCLYFFAAPLFHWLAGGSELYLSRLDYTEGVPRLLLITVCIVAGGICFFLAYFHTRPGHWQMNLPPNGWPKGTWVVLIVCLLGATYSLYSYREFFGAGKQYILIEGGKFTGEATGYVYIMHQFALFPIIFLFSFPKTRFIGFLIAFFYLAGRLEDSWNRTTLVALCFSMSMALMFGKHKKWPSKFWIIGIIFFVVFLQLRGHMGVSQFIRSDTLNQNYVHYSMTTRHDASMLSTLWYESYLYDRTGYTYGLDLLAQLAVGPLPRKLFPWKDDVISACTLIDTGKLDDTLGYDLMSGAKSTVLGSLYSYGGVIGILIGMTLLGAATRKIDGMVSVSSNPAIRALGFVWLGIYWMLFGSHLHWGLSFLYLSSIPFILLVLVANITGKRSVLKTDQASFLGMSRYAP